MYNVLTLILAQISNLFLVLLVAVTLALSQSVCVCSINLFLLLTILNFLRILAMFILSVIRLAIAILELLLVLASDMRILSCNCILAATISNHIR